MHCAYYAEGRCRSCQWLDKPYQQQLEEKQAALKALLTPFSDYQWVWLSPCVSQETAFRHKAKMVVSGSVEKPVLGIISPQGEGVDLCGCPLYPSSFQTVFQCIKPFIIKAGLTPYDVQRKRGELKYLLLTQSHWSGKFMLRFVLRSDKKLPQIKAALDGLLSACAELEVVSVNVQPIHMAVMEGEQEIVLTDTQTLEEHFNHIPLFIRPQSFFQTNPVVAASLYATAKEWVNPLRIRKMWDLFCGVGGFGLHCATHEMTLTGIEINQEAIQCARQSARYLGFERVNFQALDSTRFSLQESDIPDLVLVNPPRRGIGTELCHYLNNVLPDYILYSSCNAETMVKDIALLAHYRLIKVKLFDMFPHTPHMETLVLLQRQN